MSVGVVPGVCPAEHEVRRRDGRKSNGAVKALGGLHGVHLKVSRGLNGDSGRTPEAGRPKNHDGGESEKNRANEENQLLHDGDQVEGEAKVQVLAV